MKAWGLHQNERGLSLIELSLAILIGSIAAYAIAKLTNDNLRNTQNIILEIEANNYVELLTSALEANQGEHCTYSLQTTGTFGQTSFPLNAPPLSIPISKLLYKTGVKIAEVNAIPFKDLKVDKLELKGLSPIRGGNTGTDYEAYLHIELKKKSFLNSKTIIKDIPLYIKANTAGTTDTMMECSASGKVGIKEFGKICEAMNGLTIKVNTSSYCTLVPPGTISYYATNSGTIPAGWLYADGRTLTKSQNSGLYKKLGEAIQLQIGGRGDSFTIPNLTGKFIRSPESGQSLGSIKATTIKYHEAPFTSAPHYHGINDPGHTHSFNEDPGHEHDSYAQLGGGGFNDPDPTKRTTSWNQGGWHAMNSSTTGISILRESTGLSIGIGGGLQTVNVGTNLETRPEGMRLVPLIKY